MKAGGSYRLLAQTTKYGRAFIGTALIVLLTACGASDADPVGETDTSNLELTTTAPPTTTTTTTATATTIEEGAALPELDGTWRADEDDGTMVRVTLRGTSYTVARGPAEGAGKFTVEGETITFHNGKPCDGVDTYTWAVEGDTLTLVPPAEIECPGRHVNLDRPLTLVFP